MGGCISTKSSSKFSSTRVVHLSGYVEEFGHPVTVGEVTSKQPNYVVCDQAGFVSVPTRPLSIQTQLQRGRLYFLLPYSFFQSSVPTAELIDLAKKLTSTAKSYRPRVPVDLLDSPSSYCGCDRGPVGNSLANVFKLFVDETPRKTLDDNSNTHSNSKPRPWKPLLSTIREKSFTRIESDKQENDSARVRDKLTTLPMQ